MKGDRTTTLPHRGGIPHGTRRATVAAADATLARLNGGLPPMLHTAPRPQLLAFIKKQHAEIRRLRLVEAGR
jgi:hypothetical protein